MINANITKRNIVAKIRDVNILEIEAFIQGAVYAYCKNSGGWFSARTLFGGDNYDWNGTPLIVLYDWHETNGSSDPVKMAGKDLGWLLLGVLKRDSRLFETRKGYTREYLWVKGSSEI